MKELRQLIRWVEIRLRAVILLKALIVGLTVGLLLSLTALKLTFIAISGLFACLVTLTILGFFQEKRQESVRLIHQNSDVTEYSLALLNIENPNMAEQLQLDRLMGHFTDATRMPIRIPVRIRPYLLGLGVAAVLAILVQFLKLKPVTQVSKAVQNSQHNFPVQNSPIPQLVNASVQVNPPAYTGLTTKISKDLNVSAIEGSQLKWDVKFNKTEDLKVMLVSASGGEQAFKKVGNSYEYTDRLTGSGLYGFKAMYKDSLIFQSDFFQLEAIPDLPPRIEPVQKDLYQFHFLNDPKKMTVSARVSDDFLVKDVYLVATLARGTGESVKFREMKLDLSDKNFKTAQVSRSIDLKTMGFAPGDELYYYWAAHDHKTPEPNLGRSDTYFVIYRDTAEVGNSELATMAVNILPEYFRSQRQIIIDTEKLIAQRKKLSKQDFNSTSNEIGFDQKALRMRYGQYLGEENEGAIGGGHDHDDDNPLAGFMHDHDAGEEFQDISEAARRNEGVAEKSLEDILADYIHNHDDAEYNTFYEVSTRTLLKASLEQMWQSELHLRLFEPEKALPYEYKALEFLKEAQQKARTYVARVSYDPPPIKQAEKRMTGELKKFNALYKSTVQLSELQLSQLVAEVLGWADKDTRLNDLQKQRVLLLSNQLIGRVMNASLREWKVPTLLLKILNDQSLNNLEKKNLKTGLYLLLGEPGKGQASPAGNEKKLKKAFLENL